MITLKTNRNIQGIIFDLGSTILEYESDLPWDDLSLLCLDAGYEFLKKAGYGVVDKDTFVARYIEIRNGYRKKAGETLQEWIITDAIGDLMKSCGLNGDHTVAERFFEAYHIPLAKQVIMFSDAPKVLRALSENGYKIGLVSNTIFPEKVHIDELTDYGIFPLFDFTIFSSSFGKRKPHRDIYERAAGLMGLPPGNLLFVGDRYLEDCRGPMDFGMRAIIKFREGREYPDPMPAGVPFIHSLTELLAYLGLEIDDN